MIALALRVARTSPPRTWLIFGLLGAFLLFGAYCAHRGAEGARDRQTVAQAKIEARATSARETAAEEALTDHYHSQPARGERPCRASPS